MRSVSGDFRFVRSYPLASVGHVQNFERTPPDLDFRWMNVSCALNCGFPGSGAFSCVGHPEGILYVSVDVRSTRVVKRSTSGQLTIKRTSTTC